MKILITIIIASFNSEKTIRRALQSVKDQSFQEWECLVVDGASKDKTIDVVKEFVSQDARFRYISEPDKGIYDAFNKGWKNAQGKWIYYLGSDDELLKNGLLILSKNIEEQYPIISANVFVKHFDGGMSLWKAGDGHPKVGCHQGMIMKKDVINSFEGFDMNFKILADYDLIVKILLSGKEIKVVTEGAVAYFYQGGTTSSFQKFIQCSKERYQINKKLGRFNHPLLSSLYTDFVKIRSFVYRVLLNSLK